MKINLKKTEPLGFDFCLENYFFKMASYILASISSHEIADSRFVN